MDTESLDALLSAKSKLGGLSVVVSSLFEGGGLAGRQKDDLEATGLALQSVIADILADLQAAGAVDE